MRAAATSCRRLFDLLLNNFAVCTNLFPHGTHGDLRDFKSISTGKHENNKLLDKTDI
jgi:hypothetical protein